MDNFKHNVKLQLRFNDADSLGHINNSVYFSFYDLGKTEYFRTVKGYSFYDDPIDLVVAHVEVDFMKPVFLNDTVSVYTRVTRMGNKSMNLEQKIIDEISHDVKCVCNTVMVGFDFTSNETIEISNQWRELVNDYEGSNF